MAKTVFVDRNVCIGCGACAAVCPEIFSVKEDAEHNGEYKSFSKGSVDHEAFGDKIGEAISVCPVQCIKWEK